MRLDDSSHLAKRNPGTTRTESIEYDEEDEQSRKFITQNVNDEEADKVKTILLSSPLLILGKRAIFMGLICITLMCSIAYAAMREMAILRKHEDMIDCDEKYLSYEPVGGMSNQIIGLRSMIQLARASNRTLILTPMRLRGFIQFTTPLRNVIDADMLEAYTKVMFVETTWQAVVSIITAKCSQAQVDRVARWDIEWTDQWVEAKVYDMQYALVHIEIDGLWKPIELTRSVPSAHFHVAFAESFRKMARKLVLENFPQGKFYAIHGRLGDLMKEWKDKTSFEAFVTTPQFQSWNKSLPVYLATADPNNPFFDALKSAIHVVPLKNLGAIALDLVDIDYYVPEVVEMDVMGILEKLICAQAIEFMGSEFSTFSMEILLLRENAESVFPEALAPP